MLGVFWFMQVATANTQALAIDAVWITPLYFTMLMGIVLLHELGHSVVAQRYGVTVVDITLWPLGGMARMSEMPESPKIEALVALAGPAVNFVLVALALPFWFWMRPMESSFEVDLALRAGLSDAIMTFILINLMLGLFNLVPAFPMDGGRVLRAALATSGDWLRATESAVVVGRFFAFAMIFSYVFLDQCALPLIGMFILWAGFQELWSVRKRHGASAFGFPTGMFRNAAGQDPFGIFRGRGAQARDAAPQEFDTPEEAEAEVSEDGPRRPQVDIERLAPGTAGFSADDIDRLERFPGRIRRPDSE